MPFLIMRRTDIPNGVLQILDLKPNTASKNYIYEPGVGQTKYVQNIPIQDVVATTATEVIRTAAQYRGLAAYLIDNVEDQNESKSLSATISNDSADAIAAQAVSGSENLTAGEIAGLLVANGAGGGTSLTAGESTGNLEDMLSLLAGRDYEIPAGAALETAGAAFITGPRGAFSEPFRKLEDTGPFKVSLANGNIAGMTAATFNYLGTTGIAVDAFNDDGTRI
jgi:hypothetical protein